MERFQLAKSGEVEQAFHLLSCQECTLDYTYSLAQFLSCFGKPQNAIMTEKLTEFYWFLSANNKRKGLLVPVYGPFVPFFNLIL